MDDRLGPIYRGVFPDLRAATRPSIDVRPVQDPFLDTDNAKHPSGIIRYWQTVLDDCGCFEALQVTPDGYYDTVTVCATRVQGDVPEVFPLYLSHEIVTVGTTPGRTGRVGLALPGSPFVDDITDVKPVAAALSGPSQAANIRYDLPLCNRPLLVWSWDNGINVGTTARPIRIVVCLMTLRH